MSDVLDFSFDTPTEIVGQQLAQGIFCQPFHIALPYTWSTSIVDEFELVAVPNSAPWLAGIANVAGVILPVVDLSVYFSPLLPPKPINNQHRLLVGGDLAGDDGAVPMALLFEGLPNQVRSIRQALTDLSPQPRALTQLCIGELTDERGRCFFELDPDRLTQALLQAL